MAASYMRLDKSLFSPLAARQGEKTFDKSEIFTQLIAARTQVSELESIVTTLSILEKPIIIGDPDDFGLLSCVPAYWGSLAYMLLGDIQEALSYVGKQHHPWNKRPIVSSYSFPQENF